MVGAVQEVEVWANSLHEHFMDSVRANSDTQRCVLKGKGQF